MAKRQKQIELLETRIRYLKTIDKLLERDAPFKEVVAFIEDEDNEDVAGNKVFLQALVRLLDLEDDFSIHIDDADDDFDE